MTGTIEVIVRVYLTEGVDSNSEEAREIAQAIVDGVGHPMIDHTELVEFDDEGPDDARNIPFPGGADWAYSRAEAGYGE